MNVSTLITPNSVSILLDGEFHVIPKDHPNFTRICEAITQKAWDTVKSLVDVSRAVADWMKDYPDLTITNGQLVLNGRPFSEEVSEKVFKMIEAGNDAGPLVNFLRKVRKNPSNVAQRELLLFCVANGFLLHENGNIVAYKSVREDYTDIHSGKIRNAVGDVITMNRGDVDDIRENTCSHGLHFAAFDYASTWAGGRAKHLMIMSVDPEHVVSVPADYNNQKGRCCQYTVVGEVKNWEPLPEKEVYSDSDFDDSYNPLDEDDPYSCDNCGGDITIPFSGGQTHDYCPHCGASQF